MTRDRSLLSDPRLYAILSLAGVGVLGGPLVSPTLPGMASAFELTEARVGLAMTAFFLPAAVAIPVVGALADAWGRRPIILGSLAVFGVTGVSVGLVDSFAAVLALRAIQGLSFPGLLPLSVTVVGDLYDGVEATRAQGFRTSMNGLAGIVAPAVAGVTAGVSWRLSYSLYALALPALLLCYVALPETVGPGETAGSNVRAGTTHESSDAVEGPMTTGRRVRDRVRRGVWVVGSALTAPVVKVIAATFAVFFVRFGLVTFVPLYVVTAFGASDAVGGIAVALVGLGRFIVAPAAGRLVARFSRRSTLFGGLGIFAVGTALLLFAPGPPTLLAAIALLSVGEGAFNPVANDFVTAATPTAVRGRVVGVLEVGKTVAVAASPVAFGAIIAASSYDALFLLGGLVVGAMAVLVGSAFGEGDGLGLNEDLSAK